MHQLGFLKRAVNYISFRSSNSEEDHLLKDSLPRTESSSSSLALVPATSRSSIGSENRVSSPGVEERQKPLPEFTSEEVEAYWESKIKELEEEQKVAFEEIRRGKLHPDDRLLSIKKCRLKSVQDLYPDKDLDPMIKSKVNGYFVQLVLLFDRFIQEAESIAEAHKSSGMEDFMLKNRQKVKHLRKARKN